MNESPTSASVEWLKIGLIAGLGYVLLTLPGLVHSGLRIEPLWLLLEHTGTGLITSAVIASVLRFVEKPHRTLLATQTVGLETVRFRDGRIQFFDLVYTRPIHHELMVTGITLEEFASKAALFLKDMLKRGVRVRILLLNPASVQATKGYFPGQTTPPIHSIRETVLKLAKLKGCGDIEVRFTDQNICTNAIMIDGNIADQRMAQNETAAYQEAIIQVQHRVETTSQAQGMLYQFINSNGDQSGFHYYRSHFVTVWTTAVLAIPENQK